MSRVYLSLGSNLGDRGANLRSALEALSEQMSVEQVSSIYETEPVGYSEQGQFLNMACRADVSLDPCGLLSFVKEIEEKVGRVPSFRNGPRLIDIDILFYDDKMIETDELTVPHREVAHRAFVLVPLAEIAPDLVHPVIGKTIDQLLSEITLSNQVRKWKDV